MLAVRVFHLPPMRLLNRDPAHVCLTLCRHFVRRTTDITLMGELEFRY